MDIDKAKKIVEAIPNWTPTPLRTYEEEAIKVVLDALPEWIPVTEKLPEIGEYVLCMIRQRYNGQFHVCRYVDKDRYINHPYFDWRHNGFPDVIAWMPLPEAYHEESKKEWIHVNNTLYQCPYCGAVQFKSCMCKDCKKEVTE